MVRVILVVLAATMAFSSCGRITLTEQKSSISEGKILLPSADATGTYLADYIADGCRKFDIHIKSDMFRPGAEAYVRENTQGHTEVDARIVVTQERVKTGMVRNGRIIINYGISARDFDLLPMPPIPLGEPPDAAPNKPRKPNVEIPPPVRL